MHVVAHLAEHPPVPVEPSAPSDHAGHAAGGGGALARILAAREEEERARPGQPRTTLEWLRADRAARPGAGYTPQTLASTARRVAGGEDLWHAVKEFLDDAYATAEVDGPEKVAALVAERPEPLGDRRHDAFFGALAEHLAVGYAFARPAWAVEPGRFLAAAWFPSRYRGFDALAVRSSPAAFRRRGVFIDETLLDRC